MIDRLGVVGNPGLARQLETAGLTVVSDNDPLLAVAAITRESVPLVMISDGPSIDPFIRDWVTISASHVRIVIFGCPDGVLSHIEGTAYLDIDPPVDAASILSRAGFSLTLAERVRGVMIGRESRGQDSLFPQFDHSVVQPPVPELESAQAAPITSTPVSDPDTDDTLHPITSSEPSPPLSVGDAIPTPTRQPQLQQQPQPQAQAQAQAVGEPHRPASTYRAPHTSTITTTPQPDTTTPPPARHLYPTTHTSHPVIITLAAKGGVLKTTTALALAQRAGETGKTVTLIDGNRGQGDISKILRLSTIPTIYDYATGAPFEQIHITPDMIGTIRSTLLDPLTFALIAAPRPGTTSKHIVTDTTYRDVIHQARAISDLTIIDTQISEDTDNSGLFDHVFIPLMAHDAWIVALTDPSTQSIDNLFDRLTDFEHNHGIDPARVLVTMTKTEPSHATLIENFNHIIHSEYGTPTIPIPYDEDIPFLQSTGHLLSHHPAITPTINQILLTITGDPVFDQPTPEQPHKRFHLPWRRHP